MIYDIKRIKRMMLNISDVNLRQVQGITMIELIAALAIISVVIIGALALYGVAAKSSSAQQMMRDILAIKLLTQKIYAQSHNYGAVDGTVINNVLITAGGIPSTIKVDTTTNSLFNSFGGIINVRSFNNGGSFQIGSTMIPEDVCISLLASASDWASVNVTPSNAVITTFPILPDTADNACSPGNNVVWFMSRN